MSRRIAATLVLLSLSPGCSIPDSWSVDRGGRLYVPSDGAVYIVNPAFDKATLCVKLDKGGITHVQATPRGDRIPGRLFRLHIDTGAVEDLSEAFEALGLDP